VDTEGRAAQWQGERAAIELQLTKLHHRKSAYRAHTPHHNERNDREGHSLSPEGLGPKAFMSNMCDARFLKHFQAPNNVVKYDGKMNPIIWLEYYHLACTAGGEDDNLFTIQFLPIYLADTARVWLDHLPRNTIDN
jgi:hypothetical protein